MRGPEWTPCINTIRGKCYHRSAKEHGHIFGTGAAILPRLEKLPWKEVQSQKGIVTRKSAWFTDKGCTCNYSYGKWPKNGWVSTPFNDLLSEMAKKLEELFGFQQGYFNSCNGNCYTLPNHDLYWHADNEPMFREADAPKDKREVFIASVSFGASRKFKIQSNFTDEPPAEVDLQDGDILTMEEYMQDWYRHAIAPGAKQSSASSSSSSSNNTRYNFTFRHIKRHHKDCPAS